MNLPAAADTLSQAPMSNSEHEIRIPHMRFGRITFATIALTLLLAQNLISEIPEIDTDHLEEMVSGGVSGNNLGD